MQQNHNTFQRRTGLVVLGFVFLLLINIGRLFYLQVIRHDYYQAAASQAHIRKYQINPLRGQIYLKSRDEQVPIVLNRNVKTLYADPRYIEDIDKTANELAKITKDNPAEYKKLLENNNYYAVLKKRLEPAVAEAIDKLELPGVGLNDEPIRVYPEGSLAAHILGFVNDEGKGQYGLEEYFDRELQGSQGLLNARTDTRGIPIATSDNVQVEPKDGNSIVLTIDRNIQAKVEEVLAAGAQKYRSSALSAVIIDPTSGAVLAMANYPTFNPAEFQKVEDYSIFINRVSQGLFEPGSGFKIFSMSTGLDLGAVTPTSTYHDTGSIKVDDRVIYNVETERISRTRTMTEVITRSVNTGVVHVLRQLGGGEINKQAKERFFSYLTQKFRFGQKTNIELAGESESTVNGPDSPNVQYANMAFGQGLTATMLQMASALSAIVNGGTYYQPRIVERVIGSDGKTEVKQPTVVAGNILKQGTVNDIKAMMETVVQEGGGFGTKIAGYRIGGKTGTAQIPDPAGGYFTNRDIGSFIGFAPFDKPRFVMIIRVDEPKIAGFAGSGAAGPIFGDIMKWLLNYNGIPPG